MAPYLIRQATADDAVAIAACLRSAFEPYRATYTPAAFSDTVPPVSGIRQRLIEMDLLVAISDGGLIVGTIGYQVLGAEEAHIRGMAVAPEYLGRGVARMLIDAVEKEIRRRQCVRISLDTTQPLERAMAFYERNGFRRSGTVRDFFGMPLVEYIKVLQG